MFFSLRHFLSVMLLGSLFSFQAFASLEEEDSSHSVSGIIEEESVDGAVSIPIPWLPVHQLLLDDLHGEYSRAKGTGRFFDISADVFKVIGYTGVGATTALAYLETALGGGYWALAAGLAGSISGALLVLAEKADGGVKGKLGEINDILSRIEGLELRRLQLGISPHNEEVSIEIEHSG